MMLQSLLRRDERGIGAVEFALVAPALIAMIVGISQMGKLFFANADMKNAAAAGARVASVWPVPEDPDILAAINDRLASSTAHDLATPSVVRGTDANGNPFIEIKMAYKVPLEFIFFEMPTITLRDSRKVYTQVLIPNSTSYTSTGSTGGTTGGTTTTTTGGDTSSTTTGGDTSSTTTGGDTGSTSATSAGGTTSSTSASSSSGDNGSSGDNNGSSGSNNGSSGHSHGNCNKKC